MLVDKFNRIHDYLRISLTDKCNLRCTYCNPVDLPKGYFSNCDKMSADEIDTIAGVFVKEGVNKIRLTGGEPLVRKDAADIIKRLSKYHVELVITTNGVFVDEFLEVFKNAGIRSINVSLDSLNSKRNHLITGRDEWKRVMQNINLLLKNNFHVKVNTVIMKGVNENELTDFVAWTEKEPVHVRFIEFMPFTGNHWSSEKVFTYREMLERIAVKYEYVPLHNEVHDTTMKYQVPDHQGTFAIISTMSKPFCGGCNRMRLTTDGKMKNCLFSKTEVDILSALRRGQDIISLIKQCVGEKKEALGGQFDILEGIPDVSKIQNRSMIQIGG